MRLQEVINVVLEIDVMAVELINHYSLQRIKKLLAVIATMVPVTPNISRLSSVIEINRSTLMNYLFLLDRAGLIQLLYTQNNKINAVPKPAKVYMDNTNIAQALAVKNTNIGSIRETFFFE